MQKRSVVTLISALLAVVSLVALADAPGKAVYVGSYRWTGDHERFGGFSGLEIADNGADFQIVSDGGLYGSGHLVREGDDGQITGVADFDLIHLRSPKGDILYSYWDDGEGLAVAGDGGIYISFEGEHRVWRYDDPPGNSIVIPQHPDFVEMQNNSALEVLAIDAAGSLFTLPERSGVLTRPFPVYRFRGGVWDQPFGIPRRGSFLPVGGDFGPDGKFYLLERDLTGFFGFRTRVRRFDISGDVVTGEEQILQTRTGEHDNLEGIAVWQDASGRIRITLVSDDNYRAFQRTEFVEYSVTE